VTVRGVPVNMHAMDTSTTGYLPRHAALFDHVERCIVGAVRCLLEQQLGFVPAWALLGDYVGSVGVRVVATLARTLNHRGEP